MSNSDWYWAELRSATAAGEAERGWQLLAAWPSNPAGDPHEAETARKYFMTGLCTEKVAATAWLLRHFRMMPVPLKLVEPPEDDGVRDDQFYENYGRVPPYHPWNGQVLRSGGEWSLDSVSGGHGIKLIVTSEGGEAALEANLEKDARGRPVVYLRNGIASYGRRHLEFDEDPNAWGGEGEGVSPPEGHGYHGNGIHGRGMFYAHGEKTLGNIARMMQRFGHELEALASPGLNLTWDPDILIKLQEEGAGPHPSLIFVEDGLDPESQTPSGALREKWLGLRPPPLATRDTVRSWYGSPELDQCSNEIQTFLWDRGEEGMNCWSALALLNLTPEEVAAQSGDAADIQLHRLGLVQEIRPLLEQLDRLNRTRRAERMPRVGDRYVLVQDDEGGDGDEGDEGEDDNDIELE
jgi:hypothetical protein